jgi:hypothetical protein
VSRLRNQGAAEGSPRPVYVNFCTRLPS